ncbi:MAG: hypothetical protein ACFB11_00725 [Paracoccaceae bacterium]
MKKPLVHITDRAIVRYLERVYGVDVEGLRRRIGRNVQLASEYPDATAINHLGFSYKLKQDKPGKPVVTNVLRCSTPKEHGRNRKRGAHGKG